MYIQAITAVKDYGIDLSMQEIEAVKATQDNLNSSNPATQTNIKINGSVVQENLEEVDALQRQGIQMNSNGSIKGQTNVTPSEMGVITDKADPAATDEDTWVSRTFVNVIAEPGSPQLRALPAIPKSEVKKDGFTEVVINQLYESLNEIMENETKADLTIPKYVNSLHSTSMKEHSSDCPDSKISKNIDVLTEKVVNELEVDLANLNTTIVLDPCKNDIQNENSSADFQINNQKESSGKLGASISNDVTEIEWPTPPPPPQFLDDPEDSLFDTAHYNEPNEFCKEDAVVTDSTDDENKIKENKLLAVYARVSKMIKNPTTAESWSLSNMGEEEEEDLPPPIPEKHFEINNVTEATQEGANNFTDKSAAEGLSQENAHSSQNSTVQAPPMVEKQATEAALLDDAIFDTSRQDSAPKSEFADAVDKGNENSMARSTAEGVTQENGPVSQNSTEQSSITPEKWYSEATILDDEVSDTFCRQDGAPKSEATYKEEKGNADAKDSMDRPAPGVEVQKNPIAIQNFIENDSSKQPREATILDDAVSDTSRQDSAPISEPTHKEEKGNKTDNKKC
ncbi:uncharacterized protein LOC122793646 isoform X2 [Protopterus annectens]|uniref:uncharacterized protein LOC122793646 isoform X2 n=1 Tax=Protopterus annectens TaxID=7888 RepID=UPI001CFBDB6A|nr:uncharacterized protein LOC122793646 isoform X2 [Protopterus annectens]